MGPGIRDRWTDFCSHKSIPEGPRCNGSKIAWTFIGIIVVIFFRRAATRTDFFVCLVYQHVKCLAWDESGHFLATAGGSDVVVWDMEESALEEGKDNSIVCYGHAQNAKITALKFQNNGNLLVCL